MKKKSLAFLGIVIICFCFLALSISGMIDYTTYVKREEKPMLKKIIDEDSKKKQRLTQESNLKDITQEIYGLRLPNYDKNGKEVSIIRGAYTVFLKNRIYRISKPEIEFIGTGNKDNNQPKNIIITSDFGEIDKTTNKGLLYENVITRLEKDFKIYTDDLKYLPDEKIVNTDGSVTVKGNNMKITGTGFEINLSDSKALIKNDPEMEIESDRDGLFFFSTNETATPDPKSQTSITNRNIADNIFIRSSGELVFENKERLAVFNENVRISRGKSTIFADKLTVPFDSDMENLKKIIASGNVLASDGNKNAKGEKLSWDGEKQIATLEDDPVAEFFDDKVSITAAKIMFSKVYGRMDVPVSGQLTTIVSLNSNKQDENKETELILASPKDPAYESITITWKGRMTFQQNINRALFEDDVVVNKEGTKLYCEKLVIKFDDQNSTMKHLEATKDVHLIEKREDYYREARGEKLIWASKENYTELYGNPLASVRDGERQISAPKISFSEDEKKILAEGKGYLLAKSHTEKEEKDTEFIDINWNKKMIYNGKKKTANFYEMVKAIKGDDKLDCDRLDVLFHDKDKIKKITALGNVYIASPNSENTEGVGTLLVWDLMKDMAVLTGNPLAELRRSGARTFSEKIYFDINSKRVHWEGKPHWQIYEGVQ
ncbi:MAG: hypothetical protein SCARUB_00364 [Candidatus Scalindua rubra]|uniref:Organic solvent tolerance-like N-terminal domain-containing protein n=1 Tax=Candidatus Scalindua rubra TaxID=1872076 RepID=A0A1E3XFW1_9BACT|nr:MAG: hypothetical protein SCARUB_00364 [Candidatus Scalindua rubra]